MSCAPCVWLYGLFGVGIGLLLSHAGRRLAKWHHALKPEASQTRSNKHLDLWLVAGTGAGFAGLWLKYGPSVETAVLSTYFAVFLLILVLDIAHRWVPNVLLLPSAVFAVTVSALTQQPSLGKALLGGLVGFGWFYIMAIAYRGAMGAGDVKLAGVIGLATGFPQVIVALTIGILAGGVGAGLLLASGRKTRKSYIPYAPFLVTGALMALTFGSQIAGRFTTLSGW